MREKVMYTWRLRSSLMELRPHGCIMGILNVTPDSFSDGGKYVQAEAALAHAQQLLDDGADIIDIGGESTRPGAAEVTEDEETRRVLPAFRLIRQNFPRAVLSIDTRHAEVARRALDEGADIINDVGGLGDGRMRSICAEFGCGVVLMHMKGVPATMQKEPHYDDVVREVREFFIERIRLAEEAGISKDCICLDPGIGFGKTVQHNLELINNLDALRCEGLPILMGLSRKRFLTVIGRGTVEMSLVAARNGAQVHRVHEVKELREALDLALMES